MLKLNYEYIGKKITWVPFRYWILLMLEIGESKCKGARRKNISWFICDAKINES